MFDIGFSELVIIGILALLVLGPRRLPTAARFAGMWVRKARAQWFSLKSEFERELADEQMRDTLESEKNILSDELREIDDGLRSISGAVSQTQNELREAAEPNAESKSKPDTPRDEQTK